MSQKMIYNIFLHWKRSKTLINIFKVVVAEIWSLEKKLFTILKFEIIFLWKKKHYFLWQNSKVTNNDTFNNVFSNKIFPYHRFLLIFKKWLDFHKLWLIFSGKIFYITLLFPILKISKKSSNIVFLMSFD